ncbi:MAG: hypothetical protein ACE5I5_17150 [Candidatus Heimdallarchaeota archaeon]
MASEAFLHSDGKSYSVNCLINYFVLFLSIQEFLIYLASISGPIALIWNIGTWWIGRSPHPVIGLQCELHQPNGGRIPTVPVCEVFMNVKNTGKRPLKLSEAKFWVIMGIQKTTKGYDFINPFEITDENLNQSINEGGLIALGDLQQMTIKESYQIDPDATISDVTAFDLVKPGVYKVVFAITVDRFFLSWKYKSIRYYDVDLVAY